MVHIHNNCSAINSIFKTRVHNRNLSLKTNHYAVSYITIKASHSFLLVNKNKTTSYAEACSVPQQQCVYFYKYLKSDL